MKFSVAMAGHAGVLDVVIPYDALEPIRPDLGKIYFGDRGQAQNVWQDLISDQIERAHMELEVVMAEEAIPIQKIMAWQPGDTVEFGIEEGQDAIMTCADAPMFQSVPWQTQQRLCGRANYRKNSQLWRCPKMMATIIDGVIIVLLVGSIAYGYSVSRKVRQLMATLKELEPLVNEFSSAVDKTEHSVHLMRENIEVAEQGAGAASEGKCRKHRHRRHSPAAAQHRNGLKCRACG